MKVRLLWLFLALGLSAINSLGQTDHDQRSRTPAKVGRPAPVFRPPRTELPPKRSIEKGREARMPKDPSPRLIPLPSTHREARPIRLPSMHREARPARIFPQSTVPPQDEFAATQREIKGIRPAVTNVTLECDKEVIRTTLPEIQKAYENSGSKENAQEVALTAWKEVRLASPLQPNKCMVSTSYTAFTLSLGRLIFKTNPGEANIALDGQSMPVKTLHSRLFEAGIKHKVRFSKPGYLPAEVECTAVERTATHCYAELKPVPSPLPFNPAKPVVKKSQENKKGRRPLKSRKPRKPRRPRSSRR